MIHLLLLIDRKKSVGLELFKDNTITFDSELLIPLIQSILLISQSFGNSKPKGELRELEIGDYQIGSYELDNLAYVIIQDTYDNEPFTKQILTSIINEFHDKFLSMDFSREIQGLGSIKERIVELTTTMKFPTQVLQSFQYRIKELLTRVQGVETIFLADLDDGVKHIWLRRENNIITVLMEILSEIPFERSWLGEVRLFKPIEFNGISYTHEAWIIVRIGLTDFCILARGYFNQSFRDIMLSEFESLAEEFNEEILKHL